MHFRYLSMTSGTPSEIPEYISSNESFVNIQEMSQSSPTSGSISPSSSPAADTGQPGPSAHDDTLEKKHPEYYFDDGSVEFVVEGLRYRVHQYLFSRDSPYWANIFTRPLPLEPLDLPSGKDVLDFDAFLAVLYATCYRPPGISTTREWSAVLCLATEWSFDGIRRLAIEHLEATASPIEKIVLSHSHAIPEWLPVAYVSLCQRDSPLSAAEIRAVRAEDVELIMSVREALLRERVPLDTSDVSAHVARAMELSRTAEASTSSESASEPIIPEELASTGSAAETTQAAEQRVPESPEESDFTSPPPISPLDGDLPLDDVADSIPSTSRHIATQDACAEVAAHLALLTPTNSTEVGERIVETINSSVDGHAMILQAIKDIFDKAGTGQALADVYALVCTELAWNADLNEISASLDDANPKPISGSALFRACLLDQCLAEIATISISLGRAAGASRVLRDSAIASGDTPTVLPDMLERERATIQFVGYLVNHEALDKGKLRVCLERLVPNLEDAAHDEYSVQLVCELLLAAVPRSWANLASYTALIKQARNGLQLRVSSVTYTLVQDVLQLRSEWVANDRRKRERKKKAKLEKERRGDANLE